MKKALLLIMLLAACGTGYAQVQWASEVIRVSSQYHSKQYSAEQLTGLPNAFPNPDNSPVAWSPSRSNQGEEYVIVGFDRPMQAKQVIIAENFNPGAIVGIILYDLEGKAQEVYENDDPAPAGEKGRMFSVKFSATGYDVHHVKVVFNTAAVEGFIQVDAIGISSSEDPVELQVNTAGIEFLSEPQNMGRNINTPFSELNPVIAPDGKTLYFVRKDHPQNVGGGADDIWISRFDEASGHWQPAENPGDPLNIRGYNYLNSISPDGNSMFLAGEYSSDEDNLFTARRTGAGWGDFQILQINDLYTLGEYKSFSMAMDGKTMLLSLERQDSYGGNDIYVSFKQDNNTWSVPVNLGGQINTAGFEVTPFLAADGQTLYFSSNGYPGYGNNDIYISRRQDDSWTNWSEPLNMGPGINTADWDAYYSVPASGEWAYYSSYTNSVGKADIFRIRLEEEQKPEVVGMLYGKVLDAATREPVEATIRYLIDPTEEEMGQGTSSPQTGEYKVVLPSGQKYLVYAEADGYYPVVENINLEDLHDYTEVKRSLFLYPVREGEIIPLENIFFEANKSQLQDPSFGELNRVAAFLKGNPNVKIEIGGHTNNQCSESYCLELSRNRARAVADYLRSEGVKNDQVSFKGYGSKKPIDTNATEEGRKRNQRVEFTILKVE